MPFQRLRVTETTVKPDCKTAATQALFYACSKGDLKLVKDLIQDLRELIDINALIDGKSIAEWTIGDVKASEYPSKAYQAYLDHMKNAMNICRYLIICYGSKINLNPPSGLILRASLCFDNVCEDIVYHLARTYGADLVHVIGTHHTFRTLIKNDHDDEAVAYLHQHRNRLAIDLFGGVFMAAIGHASTHIFKVVLELFGSQAESRSIDYMFSSLCGPYPDSRTPSEADEKITLALDLWADKLKAKTVEKCLVNQWIRAKDGRSSGRIAQELVSRCLGLIQDQSIQIALAVCGLPQNLELFDAVFDSNIDEIRANPQLLFHVLVECCNLGDTSTFRHIAKKCGSLIYPTALELWFE